MRTMIHGRTLAALAVAGLMGTSPASGGPDGRASAHLSGDRGPANATAQDTTLLDRMRSQIASLTRDGGAWWTSNEAYAAEDQGQDAYWLRHAAPPGAVASTACLWGERQGALAGVYWHFFTGPDPRTGTVIAYQSSPGGMVGIGEMTFRDAEVEVVQTFFGPDGARFRVRHIERPISPDSVHSESFRWQDGAWQPQRTYVWVRRHHGAPPC